MSQTTRICRITGEEFRLDELEHFLLRRIPELNPYLGIDTLPLPTVHPLETIRRMYAFGGLRRLYKTTSAVSGKSLLTRYNPALGTKVCTTEEFFSDLAANEQYGIKYDFQKSFFEQFGQLLYSVSLPPLNRTNCENSEYCNGAVELKDCYLCFGSFRSRDCLYCLGIEGCTDCIDCVGGTNSELCYSSINILRCYNLHNSLECTDCQDSFGCFDCRSCHHCFGCVGLSHKSYCVFNEQLTKENYLQFIQNKKLNSYSGRQSAILDCSNFAEKLGHQPSTQVDCKNCTGIHLLRCENVHESTNMIGSTNCSYLIMGKNAHYFCKGYADSSEFGYTAHLLGANIGAFSYSLFGGECLTYSAFCYGCSHCFGCVGLRNKSYCLLNTQYTKQEYFELVPKVVGHMTALGEFGEWFPQHLAPHSYQESSIHEFFHPIPLETARSRGYRVIAEEQPDAKAHSLDGNLLPDLLSEEELQKLQNKAISCAETQQRFNFQKQELEFYLRNNIPAPRVHWNQRLQKMINVRGLIPAI